MRSGTSHDTFFSISFVDHVIINEFVININWLIGSFHVFYESGGSTDAGH